MGAGPDPAMGAGPDPAMSGGTQPAMSGRTQPAAVTGERAPLRVYHSRGRGALVASLVLALLGLPLLTAASAAERIVGGACSALFGVGALVLARDRKSVV